MLIDRENIGAKERERERRDGTLKKITRETHSISSANPANDAASCNNTPVCCRDSLNRFLMPTEHVVCFLPRSCRIFIACGTPDTRTTGTTASQILLFTEMPRGRVRGMGQVSQIRRFTEKQEGQTYLEPLTTHVDLQQHTTSSTFCGGCYRGGGNS